MRRGLKARSAPNQAARFGAAAVAAALLALSGTALATPVKLTDGLAKSGLPLVTAKVDDQSYKRPMTYEGYRLVDVLRKFFPKLGEQRKAGEQLVLRAADGYAPTMSLERALKGKGVIAIRDLSRPKSDPWAALRQGKKMISPAPYYLVWPGVDPKDPAYKWPYQLVEIDIVPAAAVFGAARPGAKATRRKRVRHGFALFAENCISCHSVNLVGGTLGPELNVPRNVTEYWAPSHLRRFIRNASSYRARSKMPPFPDLSRRDVDDLLTYLAAKGKEKICGAGKPCPK